MAKLDPQFTAELQAYLAADESQRSVPRGAELLLRLRPDRGLYRRIMAAPAPHAALLFHELEKYLRLRLDGQTRSSILRMEREDMPPIKERLASIETQDPKPWKGRGLRPDHEHLPPDIRALPSRTEEVYRRMKKLYNQLLTMENALPCDRYEYLITLKEEDNTYRALWREYDHYKPTE